MHTEREPLIQSSRNTLPKRQLIILLYLRFCEAASIFAIYPFITEFLLTLAKGDEGKVAYYASIMDASRYSLSLVTVMFWSRKSDSVGRKPILLIGTTAIATSMLFLGLSRSFLTLVVSRCIFAAFNSNAGIIKSAIGEMTDASNSADAFALLHLPWALGMSIGPLLGGLLSKPHLRFPHLFRGSIWEHFPYLLPCGVTFLIALLAFFLLFTSFCETLQVQSTNTDHLGGDTRPEATPTFHSVLTARTTSAISNYVSLSLCHMAYTAVQPLFLALPVNVGGLGLPPKQIGYILGIYGIANSLVQAFCLGPLVRRFGLRRIFKSAVMVFIPIFCLFPLMNYTAKNHHTFKLPFRDDSNLDSITDSKKPIPILIWSILTLQLTLLLMAELGYGCIYIYITSSVSSNKRSLGTVNGIAQTSVSVARLVGPALANGLLAVSIERKLMGGYAVYFVLGSLVWGSLWLVGKLPMDLEAWKED